MADNNSSNGSPPSNSGNDSPPPTPPSPPSDDSEPPQSSPSKSPPPPSPPNSPPPSPPPNSPPPPSQSAPPPPSKSPPPSSSPPPPSPPPPSQSPPPAPKLSPPPPSNISPPPKSPPPQNTSPTPPAQPPPTPPPAAPPPSTPTPPPSNGDSPPPSPSQQSSPPQPQTPPPPPPNKTFSPPTPPAPGSNVTPAKTPPPGPVPKSPPFSPPTPRPKPGVTPSNSPSPPSSHDAGANVQYYVEEKGVGNASHDGFYSTQLSSPVTNHSEPASQPMGQMIFSYDKVLEITDGFSSQNVIGEGGFGYVYKASMPDGRIGAVKLLKAGGGQGEREFRAEVDSISHIHHRHLVSLLGYCICEQKRVLIYEFVPNGNLSHHMHGSGVPVLSWEKRMKIAFGASRGLAYLHEGCNPKIIHRDIKSANILLDDAFEAQVADFGLAKLTDDADTHVSTRVMGTFGYMAPEYATSGKLTDRSDVFSFGVVLLELITGRKPVDATQPVGEESLVEWARPLLLRAIETGDFSELVDPRLEGQYVDGEMFRMIEAAVACVRHSAPKRPRMVQVARALDTGDQYDLSNGVKYGQSTVYDSDQYNKDLMRFKRMANGSFGESDSDSYSSDYRSKEMSAPQYQWRQSTSSIDSEAKTFYSLKNSIAENRS
ncbi:hypothetical protein TanjilG_25576 [Lupinus angustifolius]|uniref:non-specific serine/threonine protein kinase n=1 Tax=Lupinus angustifolius TaxID=3871 RepID=A0A4P1QTJ7_LUPAN|nr:hypothetical protein TanjilG_25576 [Lupinus angustifolius]